MYGRRGTDRWKGVLSATFHQENVKIRFEVKKRYVLVTLLIGYGSVQLV